MFNTLRPRQNCRHFANDIFKWIFLNENVFILHKISMKFLPKIRINNIPALVQIWLGAERVSLLTQMSECVLNEWMCPPMWDINTLFTIYSLKFGSPSYFLDNNEINLNRGSLINQKGFMLMIKQFLRHSHSIYYECSLVRSRIVCDFFFFISSTELTFFVVGKTFLWNIAMLFRSYFHVPW